LNSNDKTVVIAEKDHKYKGIGTITNIYKNEVDPQDVAKAIVLESIDNKKSI
jgi:hypothetical protein